MVGTTFTTHGWARDFGVVSRPVGVIPPKQVASARGVEFIEGWLEIGFGCFFSFHFCTLPCQAYREGWKFVKGSIFLLCSFLQESAAENGLLHNHASTSRPAMMDGFIFRFQFVPRRSAPLEVRQTAWWQLRFIRNGKWHKVIRNGAQ